MITKILFTIAVVIGVLFFFRNKRMGPAPKAAAKPVPAQKSSFGRWVAYGFAGVLVLISAGWYGLHWQHQHEVMTIRVMGGDEIMVYKAYKKDLKGNRFQTIDGRTVILGDSERVEILGSE